MKKINNADQLEAEKYRLMLRQQKLLHEIRYTWKEIKQQSDPAILATEAAIRATAGKSPTGKIVSTAAEIIIRYLRKK